MPNNNPKGQRTTPSKRMEKPQKTTKSLTKQQAVFLQRAQSFSESVEISCQAQGLLRIQNQNTLLHSFLSSRISETVEEFSTPSRRP
jgi:hypothetical protein